MTSGSTRIYIVSEPEATLKYSQIPSGAHLRSVPHVKPALTDEDERSNAQVLSTDYAVPERGAEGGVFPGEGKQNTVTYSWRLEEVIKIIHLLLHSDN